MSGALARHVAVNDEKVVIRRFCAALAHVLKLFEAVAAMVEHRVQNDAHAARLARVHKLAERFVAAEMRVYVVVVAYVVFVIGHRREYRREIQSVTPRSVR